MTQETWGDHWGIEYRRDLVIMDLQPVLSDLQLEGKLGRTIVDIGSGYYPVSNYLLGNHDVITIDVEGEAGISGNKFHVKHDVESLADADRLSTHKALLKMARYLHIDARAAPKEQVDAMIFSRVLNYVDFRKVLSAGAQYLKPGGLFIIVNEPDFGYPDLLSKRGVKKNSDLLDFMDMWQDTFTVIKKKFPWVKSGSQPNEKSMLILVAQKRGAISKAQPTPSIGQRLHSIYAKLKAEKSEPHCMFLTF